MYCSNSFEPLVNDQVTPSSSKVMVIVPEAHSARRTLSATRVTAVIGSTAFW